MRRKITDANFDFLYTSIPHVRYPHYLQKSKNPRFSGNAIEYKVERREDGT